MYRRPGVQHPGPFLWYNLLTMDVTPVVPRFGGSLPDLGSSLLSLPIHIEISQLILVVLTMLVSIFAAAVSVILVYHWRRFPFEHAIFLAAERAFLIGVGVLVAIAFVGIIFA